MVNKGQPQKAIAGLQWMRRALWLGALLLLLLSLLPYGLRLGLVEWMMASGSRLVVVEKVDFDPFIGRVELSDLYGEGARGSLRCSRVVIRFDWLPLWQRQVRIRSVELEAGSLDLDHHPVGGWAFGGLLLPSIMEGEEEEESVDGWQWAVGELELKDIAIRYRDPVGSVGVSIDQARLENLDSRVPGAGSPFALRLLSGGGVVSMEGALNPLAPSEATRLNFTVKGLPLDRAAPMLKPYGIDSLAGALQGSGSVECVSDLGNLQVSISGQLQVDDLRGAWPEGRLGSKQVAWQGEVRIEPDNRSGRWEAAGILSGDLVLQMNDLLMHADRAELKGTGTDGSDIFKGTAAVQGLSIEDFKRDRALLLLEEVSLQDMQVGWEGRVAAKEVNVASLKALEWQRKGEEAPFLLLVERGKFVGPQLLSSTRLDLGQVFFEGFEWRVEKDATGSFISPSRFFDDGEGKDDKVEEPPLVVLSAFTDIKKGRLIFQDRSVTPAYEEILHLKELRLEGVDTSSPKKETRFHLDGGIGAYSSVHLEGVVMPMADRLTMSLDGWIKDLDLPSLSPYAERYLDYQLNSGHLNAELSWRVKEGQLNSEARLQLVKLAVEPLKGKNGSRLSGILGMPVKKAISMLRDKDDTIRLSLPIKGDVRDPLFNWNSLIAKATRAAVQEAAVSYYAPLGVTLLTGAVLPPGSLFLGGKVVEWVRTMRFKPVKFLPLKSLPEAEGEGYLGEVARLLKGKPKARFVLCGLATVADLQTLRHRSGREPSESEPPLDEEREFLLELARERALAIKESLLALGIEAGRLLICSPRIELKKGGEPRVEISI